MLLCAVLPQELKAQAAGHMTPRHATTYDWSVLNRLQLLDETHAYNETFYDRGFSRMYNPQVRREYELDMWMHNHQFNEAYHWYQNPRGYRMRFGSYTKGRWAVFSELHTSVNLGAKSDFLVSAYPQQHARAERAMVEFGYQHSFGEKHKVAITHTLHEFKQDLDLTFRYTAKDDVWGELRFDFTVMNHMNNVVNKAGNDAEVINPRNRQLQTTFKTFPAFFFGRYRTPPQRNYHLDMSWGWMPRRREIFTDKTEPDFEFEQQRFVGFFNASFDVRNDWSTLGVFFYADRDNLDRQANGNPVTGEYDAEQKARRMGAFWYGYFGRVKPFARISRERYVDRQGGSAFDLNGEEGNTLSIIPIPLNYFEKRWFFETGVNLQPFKKLPFFTEFRYMSFKRDEIAPQDVIILARRWTQQFIEVIDHDSRIVYALSFIASDKFHLEVGGAYDIDGDSHANNPNQQRFDKGYGKVIVWF